MGRKEFYERLEELKLIRWRILNQISENDPGLTQINQLRQVDDEARHLKLLHQNEM